jgi:cytochrome c peroxidase
MEIEKERKMNRSRIRFLSFLGVATMAGELTIASQIPVKSDPPSGRATLRTANEFGVSRTVFTDGAFFDRSIPFFKPIGTNGRACVTCHVAQDGWTITPESVQVRFLLTGGRDPIFSAFDGTNSPTADQSSFIARYMASSMLLNKGLIRIGIGIPANAEFTLEAVEDPYGYASAIELSLFRRPIPTANLRFLTGVMWDGRESTPLTGTLPVGIAALSDAANQFNLLTDLAHQANDATRGHARSNRDLTPDEAQAIVNFELSIVAVQEADFKVGPLDILGGAGGADDLVEQDFYVSINDVLGADHFGKAFNPASMTVYEGWAQNRAPKRAQIARGEALFNSKPINITGVAGLNDDLQMPVIHGTCTTCHDSPNVGNHSVALPINIGLTDASRRTPDLPLYTLRNLQTGATTQTTDPGRALVTGKWKDIGKFKGAILRNLAGRAPYFHNGLAADLNEAVEFYDTRFSIGFTPREKDDLVAFLKTL